MYARAMPKRPDLRSPQALQYRVWYHTQRWRSVRKAQLDHDPWCELCRQRGIQTRATVCNHMDKEAKRTEEGFFRGPFNSLCKLCHDSDQQRIENGGKPRQAIGVDGWPLTPIGGQS